ncbi:MAG: hypothetical protein PHT95_06060, partial [Candidatus Omnitrophica bacterium]|nr:hypothetical protein [Candidatus Omnitrophota bacterium]
MAALAFAMSSAVDVPDRGTLTAPSIEAWEYQTKQAMVNVMFDTLSRILKLPPDLPYGQDLD